MMVQRWIAEDVGAILKSKDLTSARVYQALMNALEMLHDVGALDPDSVEVVRGRLRRRRQELTPTQRSVVSAQKYVSGRAEPTGGVVAVGKLLATLGGIDVWLMSVEFWEQEVHVIIAGTDDQSARRIEEQAPTAIEQGRPEPRSVGRSARNSRPPETPGDRMARLEITLGDDQGTCYVPRKSAAGGTGSEGRMYMVFEATTQRRGKKLIVNAADPESAFVNTLHVELVGAADV